MWSTHSGTIQNVKGSRAESESFMALLIKEINISDLPYPNFLNNKINLIHFCCLRPIDAFLTFSFSLNTYIWREKEYHI